MPDLLDIEAAQRSIPHAGGLAAAVDAQLEQLRRACEAPDCGLAMMEAIHLCGIHQLLVPMWLCECLGRCRMLVVDAHVATWDAALGRPWPKGTKLASVRCRMRVKKRIHHEVFSLIKADLSRSINRILFDEVGELACIAVSGSKAERLYYESVKEGSLNVAAWRDAARGGVQRTAAPDGIGSTD
jgi:hypothetical protein